MNELENLLREEAEHAEQNQNATPREGTKFTRPGRERAKVLSVRLNAEESERLAAQAEVAGVGPSTLARSLILRGLNSAGSPRPDDPWMESVSQRLAALEEKTVADH